MIRVAPRCFFPSFFFGEGGLINYFSYQRKKKELFFRFYLQGVITLQFCKKTILNYWHCLMLTVVHLLYVYFRMKWKLMGLIGMDHCHRDLMIAQSVSLRPNQLSVIKRCRGLLIWLIPSLSVIVMELICTCRLEL